MSTPRERRSADSEWYDDEEQNPPSEAELIQTIEQLRAINAELLAACEQMVDSHGMHGPCTNHNCSDCRHAYKSAQAAIAKGGTT